MILYLLHLFVSTIFNVWSTSKNLVGDLPWRRIADLKRDRVSLKPPDSRDKG